MANTIQIKRAGSAGSTVPSSLVVGELAYAENGSKLYIGTSGSSITEVGGSGHFAVLASPALTGTPTAPTAAASTNTTQLATTAFVDNSFAPLASPTLTGTPSAPTATASTNTTQIASTAFVQTSYAPLASPTLTGTPAAPTAATSTNTTQIATTAFIQTELSSYAPVSSPALTDTPTAPTAAASTNTTQIATTAYVTTAVSNLIDSAPALLNTLDELAAAIGDDANYAATITTALGLKLSTTDTIDGGTF